MEFEFQDINQAFAELVRDVHEGHIPVHREPSRYGDVIRIAEPVLVTYANPRKRVLFNQARDCNPFFHLFEALWMLAGREDVEPLAYYNGKMREFSDDGEVYHGAYGHRWRHHFLLDQLDVIADELYNDPGSRRVVLQMWDCKNDLGRMVETRDKPCNTQAYFAIREECATMPDYHDQSDGSWISYLDMTVCNRSNDMIWGMLGANVVHFSFLQEYLAGRLGVEVGKYHQFTNNLHVYIKHWQPEKWLAENGVCSPCRYSGYPPFGPRLNASDEEIIEFVDAGYPPGVDGLESIQFKSTFLQEVARPMCLAFSRHKMRAYNQAHYWIDQVVATDWRRAGRSWIARRQNAYELKQETQDA